MGTRAFSVSRAVWRLGASRRETSSTRAISRVEGAPSIPVKKKPNDRDGSAGLRDSGPAAGRAREARSLNRHARGSNGGRRRSGDAPREPARRLVVLVFRLFTRASHRDGLERDGAAPGAPGGLQGGHAADGHELKREERHLCGWNVRYQPRQECPRRGGRDDYREIQRSGKKSAADRPDKKLDNKKSRGHTETRAAKVRASGSRVCQMATAHPPPRHARTNSEIERVRDAEWTLRSLESELEASLKFRDTIEHDLRRRLDEQKAENDALRAENARLKLEARGEETESVWHERSLEVELESQVAWQRQVAFGIQSRLDASVAECARLREENVRLRDTERSDESAAEWRLRSLEADLEAQAQWRQSVVDELQRRLAASGETEQALRAELALARPRGE